MTQPTHPPRPVFVFGIGRSGTTLLAWMLDRHPRLSIYVESGFLNLLPSDTAERVLTSDAEVDALLDGVGDLAAQGVAREAVVRRFATTDRSVRALFDTLLRLRMEGRGKQRYGEKTPSHFTKVAVLRAWYPDAQFVYLRRDPRDAYASFKHSADHRQLPWGDRTLLGRCLYWNYYERARADARRRFPEHVHEVVFEALLRDPTATLTALCEFLGEPFDPAMLAVAENNSSFPETRLRPGVRPEALDRRRRLRRTEALWIELVCGEPMLGQGLCLSPLARGLVPILSACGFYALSRRLHRGVRRRGRGGE